MSKLPLQIILEFDKGVRFEKEVVGKSLDFNIKDHKGKLYFPELVNNDIQKPKAIIKSLFTDSLLKYCWGKYEHDFIIIKSLLLTFEVDNNENYKKKVNHIYISVKKWFQNLKELIEIYNEISFYEYKQKTVNYPVINAKLKVYKENIRVPIIGPPNAPTISQTEVYFEIKSIDLLIFKQIVDSISNLNDIPTELSLLNTARKELCFKLRRAVIDCSTALEITLNKICEKKLLEIGNENFTKNLLDNKYKTLGNRLHLAFLLNLFSDDKYHEDIVSIRNKIIHKGYNPSDKEAKIAYEKSSNLIKRFSDLEYFN